MSRMQEWKSRPLAALLVLLLSLSMVAATAPGFFPDVIHLPNGFQPEGIASGNGTTFYAGSIATGAVYRGDLRSGQGSVLVPPQAGRQSIGLKYDPRTGYLFVAGGTTGYAYIYNGATGANVAAIQLTTGASFINDVVITEFGAYFTNSFQPVFYRVPLDSEGQLVNGGTSEEMTLGGEYKFTPGAFNGNGIAATPDGAQLIIVNTSEGALYRVDPATGSATRIDLGGGSVTNGDGILLQGKTLYVVRNVLNQVAVVKLQPDLSAGSIVATLTSPNLRVPTTIARFGGSLYAVNARFDTPPTPETEYEVVRVPE